MQLNELKPVRVARTRRRIGRAPLLVARRQVRPQGGPQRALEQPPRVPLEPEPRREVAADRAAFAETPFQNHVHGAILARFRRPAQLGIDRHALGDADEGQSPDAAAEAGGDLEGHPGTHAVPGEDGVCDSKRIERPDRPVRQRRHPPGFKHV